MPAPAPSGLDGNQVLQHSFIDATGELRVSATISPGGTEVIIDHTNDSIRLGDGTSFLTSTTVSGDIGLDVNIINSSPIPVTATVNINQPGSPAILNVSAPVSGTEYSFTLPTDTGEFRIRSRSNGKIQFAYTSGQSGTTFLSVPPGSSRTVNNLDLTSSLTVYFQSTKTTDTLEVEYWTD